MMRRVRVVLAVLIAAAISVVLKGAGEPGPAVIRTAFLDDVGVAEFQNALLPGSITTDHAVRLGSIGSDIFRRLGDPATEFWMVTDRGPNGQPTVNGASRRTFLVPEFDPTIMHVKVRGDRLEVLDAIPLLTPGGAPVTGLANIPTFDETPWNFDATVTLSRNPNGLDTEGIVRTDDGDFWLVDEYSPSLVLVDAGGHVVQRIVPVNSPLTGTSYPVVKTLPEIFNKRRLNRGFEGLALSPDGATLFIALQSPLQNPTRTIGRASRNTRVLRFDIASRQVTGEYVYRFDEVCEFLRQTPGCSAVPGDMKISSVTAVSATTLLVDERTDDVAKIYRVDLASATNILDTKWDLLTTTSPALEGLSDPASEGISVLEKELAVDLSTLPGMPKKIEGITLVNPDVIAIANDNDFGLVDTPTFDGSGNLSNDTGVKSQVIFITLARPVRD